MNNPDATILETTQNKLNADIANALDELGRYTADTHSPRTRVAALSAKLRHLEQCRLNSRRLEHEEGSRDRLNDAMDNLAKDLRVVVQRLHETPDKTVFETRAMGASFRLVGDKDDPNFQRLQKVAEEMAAHLTATRIEVAARDSDEDAKDREHQRDMERMRERGHEEGQPNG